jgi:hypothetical protein
MAKKEKLFNDRKRKVFRKYIPSNEVLSGLVVAGVLVLGLGWFFAQRDNYDPGERDISMALMEEGSVEDKLYRTPLQRWTDPAKAHAATLSGPDLGIFPAAILSGGWQAATRIQEFDESNLYEKINGAAPQYVQYGFQRLHFVGLEQPESGASLNIELYDMGQFQNALGIFSAQRGDGRTVARAGDAFYYGTGVGAIGITGPYYFKLTGDREEAQPKAEEIVPALNGLTSGGKGTPPYFALFQERLQVPFDGITFEKSDVFQFQFARDFWFATPDPEGDLRYFVHEAPDEAAAQELFGLLIENLLYDYEEVERSDTGVVLRHSFLDNYFVLRRRGATLYGVENLPQANELEASLGSLETALFDETA